MIMLYEDSMYVAWLQQEHPDDLLNGLELNGSKERLHGNQSVLSSATESDL